MANITSERKRFNNKLGVDPRTLDEIYDYLALYLDKKQRPGIEIKLNDNRTIIFKTKYYSIHFYYKVYGKNEYILLNYDLQIPFYELLERAKSDLELFIKNPELLDKFCQEVKNDFEKDFSNIIKFEPSLDPSTTTSTRQKSVSSPFFLTSKSDKNGHPHPHSATDRSDFEGLGDYVQEPLFDYQVHFSKSDRDHLTYTKGKLSENSEAFKKLIEHFDLKFENKNTWDYPIRRSKQYPLYLHITKKGSIKFWKSEYMTWEIALTYLREQLRFLSEKEYKTVLDCIKDNHNKHLFKVHLANEFYPEDRVREHFNKGKIKWKKIYGADGFFHDVAIEVDFSRGPAEYEIKGELEQSENIREISVRPVETEEKLAGFQGDVRRSNILNVANNSMLFMIQQNILPKKELEERLTDLSTYLSVQLSLSDMERNKHLINLYNSNNEAIRELSNQNAKIKKSLNSLGLPIINSVETHAKDILEDNRSIKNQIDDKHEKMKVFIDSQNKEIKKEIKVGHDKIDNLTKIVEDNFEISHSRVKKSLKLTLAVLRRNPNLTVEQLSKELSLSQNKMYYYLKKLRDKNLVVSEVSEPINSGRPPKKFSFNSKKIKKWRK